MMDLFVYGTLTFPEIVTALTGLCFKTKPAKVNGYFVTTIRAKPYPALISMPGSAAKGFILYDVDDRSQKILDEWEGAEYTKRKLIAVLDQKKVPLIAYIYKESIEPAAVWNRDTFKKEQLEYYLSHKIPTFSREYGPSAGT